MIGYGFLPVVGGILFLAVHPIVRVFYLRRYWRFNFIALKLVGSFPY